MDTIIKVQLVTQRSNQRLKRKRIQRTVKAKSQPVLQSFSLYLCYNFLKPNWVVLYTYSSTNYIHLCSSGQCRQWTEKKRCMHVWFTRDDLVTARRLPCWRPSPRCTLAPSVVVKVTHASLASGGWNSSLSSFEQVTEWKNIQNDLALALFRSSILPQILLCKKKIPHHIKIPANAWSTKCRWNQKLIVQFCCTLRDEYFESN
jgi:hypothetical protein